MFDANNEPSIEVREQLIECLKGECKNTTTDSRPLNIVVIGSPGSGKSSFINTAIASLRGDKWRSYVKSGDYGKVHTQITNRFHSVSAKSDYYIHKPETVLPTFIDINGLENNNGSFNRIFLEALFAGKIQEDEKISELKILFDENEDMFRTNLFKRSTYLEIDRIVAVASGDSDVTLPSQLYSCIKKIAQHDNVIPIFAVVTKCDKETTDESSKRKMNELAQHLGITRDNIKRVKNYCPEIDEEMRYRHVTFPHIDIPILEIMIQNPDFKDYLHLIYQTELEIKETTDTTSSASYLDVYLYIDNGRLRYKLYDKRDNFNFPIVNFPFLSGNIPTCVYLTAGRACLQEITHTGLCSANINFTPREILRSPSQSYISIWSPKKYLHLNYSTALEIKETSDTTTQLRI